MTRQHPTDGEVREAMNTVLRLAEESGRHPRISALERLLGVPHATFYRNYSELIEEFRERTSKQTQQTSTTENRPTSAETIARLRREKEDARRTVAVYAEAIRQLATENEELRAELLSTEGVTNINSRRSNQA